MFYMQSLETVGGNQAISVHEHEACSLIELGLCVCMGV